MNIQNLIAQMNNASNPMNMLLGMLNPNQQQALNLFKGKTTQQQAEEIAKVCNEKGITKEQFESIVKSFKKV